MTLDQTIRQHVEKLPLALQGEVLDYVLFLEQKAGHSPTDEGARRMKLAKALERVVAIAPFEKIAATKWEREQRDDRNLPGRE